MFDHMDTLKDIKDQLPRIREQLRSAQAAINLLREAGHDSTEQQEQHRQLALQVDRWERLIQKYGA